MAAYKTSFLACVLLFIVVVAVVTEAYPTKGARHKKRRHGSPGKRRLMTVQRDVSATQRWHHRNDRSLYLMDAVNVTLCRYTVRDDVMEGRIPRIIRYVRCVDNGCRCRVVNHVGTYACTQLVTNLSVTINDQQKELKGVPYACVCAALVGVEASRSSAEDTIS
jgi:hypothetical protein